MPKQELSVVPSCTTRLEVWHCDGLGERICAWVVLPGDHSREVWLRWIVLAPPSEAKAQIMRAASYLSRRPLFVDQRAILGQLERLRGHVDQDVKAPMLYNQLRLSLVPTFPAATV